MDKIASPQDLQSELRKLDVSIASGKAPSRKMIAAKLNELADRLASQTPGPSDKVAAALDPSEARETEKLFEQAFMAMSRLEGKMMDLEDENPGEVSPLMLEGLHKSRKALDPVYRQWSAWKQRNR